MTQQINHLSNYSLLQMFEDEVQRRHYDPCGDMEKAEFHYDILSQELRRRLNVYSEYAERGYP